MLVEPVEAVAEVNGTRRFSVSEYMRMAEIGLVREEDRVELIRGEIVERRDGKRHLFSVGDFLSLAESGILQETERLELIRGEIVMMSAIGVVHASTLNRLVWLLTNALGRQTILSIQNPVRLRDDSLPQPDVAVLKYRSDYYSERYPGPDDTLLMVEIAGASLEYDRQVKSVMYGWAEIIEYWGVNLTENRIEVYREPRPDGYRTMTRYAPGETLSPLAFADIALKVDDILGLQ